MCGGTPEEGRPASSNWGGPWWEPPGASILQSGAQQGGLRLTVRKREKREDTWKTRKERTGGRRRREERGKNLIHKRFNQFGSKYNCVDWLGKHFSNVHALGSISLRSVPDWETVAEAGSASHGEAPIA